MLQRLTLPLITTRLFLNIASCVMGFFIWYVISQSYAITRTLTLPLYFDNLSPERTISAPETSEITLRGPRHLIQKSISSGAMHINVQQLPAGKHLVAPNRENLLLPSAVMVINYNPIELLLS
jgi:hypothetical protein